MGRKIVLTGTTLTDTTAPRLVTIDPIESAGSLYLVEPMHPVEQWAAGVPATGSTVPNLFQSTLGIADPTILITGGANDGTKGKVERSTKGGLHGIVSQAATLVAGDGVQITMPASLETYIEANLGHSYYISIWDRLTRANGSGGDAIFTCSFTGTSTNQGIAFAMVSLWSSPPVGSTLGFDILDNVVGPRYANVARSAAAAMTTTPISAGPVWGAPTGAVGSTSLTNRNTRWPSFVFYRVYLEDLTVSGRTYAQVHAIDNALYNEQVLTPGGRYYGDTTPTAPATIP
jgi:hypothetical protein